MATITAISVNNPYTAKPITSLPCSSKREIELSIDACENYHLTPEKHLSLTKRITILEQAQQQLKHQQKAFARLITEEGGKPFKDALIEATRAEEGFKIAIAAAYQRHGTEIPMNLTPSSEHKMAFTTHRPIGPILAISAFNHPLNLFVHQVIPAIIANCPIIFKPDLRTPLSALKLLNILYEAGLPSYLCKLILCDNEQAEKLVSDPRFACLNFIGSAKVGWSLRQKVAPGTKCLLEHGGVAPIIITDLETPNLIEKVAKAAFYHAGQVCVSAQRIFIPKNLARKFINQLCKHTKSLHVGNPSQLKTDVGPIIDSTALNRIEQTVESALKAGAKIHLGGKREGPCYQPTILSKVPPDHPIITNEIFGPIVNIIPYEDEQQAIQQANALPYAFQASVFSQNYTKALSISEQLNANTVMINEHCAFRTDWLPFGGRKLSGLGIGGIAQTIESYSYEKLLVLHNANN